jgi:glycerol uptake facilitator-like aquaporin
VKPVLWQRSLAEGIGTFGLTFITAGAICADRYSGGELGLVGISLAAGAAFAAMALATFDVSGAHLNPAITLAAASNGALGRAAATAYVAAQVAGAALAGYCLAGLYAPEVWQPVRLGTPLLSPEVAYPTGAFIEGLLGFLLVFAARRVAEIGPSTAIVYGLATGSVLACGTLTAGTLTGAAMNPARAFGTALASGTWNNQSVYWIGPIAGGLLAALMCRLLQPRETS